MKKRVITITTVSFCLLALMSACNSPIQNNNPVIMKNSSVIISGKAEFPSLSVQPSLKIKESSSDKLPVLDTGTKGMSVKATLADVGANATVSLIFPPDDGSSPNVTIATGLTDASGVFTINPGFSPVDQKVYVLEAVKRIGPSGNDIMSVRTYIKWNQGSNSWTSITTPGIAINTKTTAITIIDSNDNSISSSDTIGKIDISGGGSVLSPIGSVTTQTITDVANMVSLLLTENADPNKFIAYQGGKYVVNKEPNHNKALLISSKICTDCDLRFEDLSSQNLQNGNLTNSDLRATSLSNSNLNSTDFTGANLNYVNFSGASLDSTKFTNANLNGANLSNASTFQNNDFTGATLTNVDFSNNNFVNNSNLTGFDLTGSNFNGANLTNVNFTSANLTNAKLSGANLTNATIASNTNLTGTSLNNVNFTGVSLIGRDFSNNNLSSSNLAGVNLSSSTLTATNFSSGNLTNADISNSALSGANLSGANLSNTNFGSSVLTNTNLSTITTATGASFLSANLSGANLSNSDFSGANFTSANLKSATLTNTNFTGSSLNNANFSNTNLTSVNFSGETNRTNIDFTTSNLNGKNLTSMDFSGSNFKDSTLDGTDFTGSNLNNTNFTNTNLTNTNLSGNVNRNNINFTSANLTGKSLTSLNFTGSNFTGSILSGVDFTGSTLTNVDFTKSNLTNANFTNSILSGANFTNATLEGNNFTGSTLTNANFSNTNLKSKNFSSMNLTGSNFTNANLTGINLTGADLTNVNFTDAKLNGATWTDGSKCSAYSIGGCFSPIGDFKVKAGVNPSVAVNNKTGDYVVVWENTDGSSLGVFAQRFNRNGVPLGSEFQVNTYTNMDQKNPTVAVNSTTGDFVITWDSYLQDGDEEGVYARIYYGTGVAKTGEFRVNTTTYLNQIYPSVAINNTTGNFVITWSSLSESSGFDIYAKIYNSAGVEQVSEYRVNSYTTGHQVTSLATVNNTNGDFFIAWDSSAQDGSGYGVYARKFNSGGTPQTSEFRVNTYTANSQNIFSVATNHNTGDFIAAWQSSGQDGLGFGVYAQRFNSSGVAQGSELAVNTYTTSNQEAPSLAINSTTGDFIAVWQSSGQDGSGYGVYAKKFNSSGTPQGSEFIINSYTVNTQKAPSIAINSVSGDFIITWEDSTSGINLKRYDSNIFEY